MSVSDVPGHAIPSVVASRCGISSSPFHSFWMGGFESACHINSRGDRLDMIRATQHDHHAEEDYRRLRRVGIQTARDGVRWHLIEISPWRYDFASLRAMAKAAQRTGIQVIWNLCHYGWPNDLDLFSPQFIQRFAGFAAAVARYLRELSDRPLILTPINEISFFSWAIGVKGCMYPYTRGRGWEVKCQLVRAAIEACHAIRQVDSHARFMQPEPLIHVIPPRDRPDLAQAAAAQREAQFQAWDMLSGRLEPQLGGGEDYLDIIGVNYYHSNQFEHPDVRLRWEDYPRDDRFVPLHDLLMEVYQRYRRPMMMAETSHFGAGRAAWLRETAEQVRLACQRGVPLHGLCLYPIIDRPDWEDPTHWHHSGLWDLQPNGDGMARILHESYADELHRARCRFAAMGIA